MRFKPNFLTLVKYGAYYCASFVVNTLLKLIVEKGYAVYTWRDMAIFTVVNTLVYIVLCNSKWGLFRNRPRWPGASQTRPKKNDGEIFDWE